MIPSIKLLHLGYLHPTLECRFQSQFFCLQSSLCCWALGSQVGGLSGVSGSGLRPALAAADGSSQGIEPAEPADGTALSLPLSLALLLFHSTFQINKQILKV